MGFFGICFYLQCTHNTMHNIFCFLLTCTNAVRLLDNSSDDTYTNIVQDTVASADHNAASYVSRTQLLEWSLECRYNEIDNPLSATERVKACLLRYDD